MRKLQGGGRQYFDSADYTLDKGAKGNPLMKKSDAANKVPVHKAIEEVSPREPTGKIKKRLSNTVPKYLIPKFKINIMYDNKINLKILIKLLFLSLAGLSI